LTSAGAQNKIKIKSAVHNLIEWPSSNLAVTMRHLSYGYLSVQVMSIDKENT